MPPNSSWMRRPSSVMKTTLRVRRAGVSTAVASAAAASGAPAVERPSHAAARPARPRTAYRRFDARSDVFGTIQVDPGVEVEQDLVVVPGQFQDPFRQAPDHPLEPLGLLADAQELGEKAAAEQGRVPAPAAAGRK